jgi:hypothetical protein
MSSSICLVQSKLVVGAIQICNVVLKLLLPSRALILPAIQLVVHKHHIKSASFT